MNGRKYFTSFGCKWTCSDEKSVDVEEKVRENTNSSSNYRKNDDYGGVSGKGIIDIANETDQHPVNSVQIIKQTQSESETKEDMSCQKFDNLGVGLQGEKCFNLQVLNFGVGNLTVGTKLEEKEGKSLEVFESPICLDKDVLPIVMETTSSGVGGMFYDVESDSSSDLFEIKNLSVDNFSTPSDNDEPKMVGILKNSMEVIPTSTTTTTKTTTKTKATIAKSSMGKKMQTSRDSILLSCKNHKAVRVIGNNTYKIAGNKEKSDPQRRQKPDSSSLF